MCLPSWGCNHHKLPLFALSDWLGAAATCCHVTLLLIILGTAICWARITTGINFSGNVLKWWTNYISFWYKWICCYLGWFSSGFAIVIQPELMGCEGLYCYSSIVRFLTLVVCLACGSFYCWPTGFLLAVPSKDWVFVIGREIRQVIFYYYSTCGNSRNKMTTLARVMSPGKLTLDLTGY